MKAIYTKYPNCIECMDLFGLKKTIDGKDACIWCHNNLTRYKVDVLQVGTGPLGENAVIKLNNGTMISVLLSELVVIGVDLDRGI